MGDLMFGELQAAVHVRETDFFPDSAEWGADDFCRRIVRNARRLGCGSGLTEAETAIERALWRASLGDVIVYCAELATRADEDLAVVVCDRYNEISRQKGAPELSL